MDPISFNVSEGINCLAQLYDSNIVQSIQQDQHCQTYCNFKMGQILLAMLWYLELGEVCL